MEDSGCFAFVSWEKGNRSWDRGWESFYFTGEGELDALAPLSPVWERGWG